MVAISGLSGQLDINSYVQNFLQVERRPLDRLENRKSDIFNKISTFSKLKTVLSVLRDRVKGFLSVGSSSKLNSRVAQSSNESIVTAEVEKNANIGVSTIFISRIASRDTVLTDNVDSRKDTLAKKFEGTTQRFTIQVGDNAPVEIAISFNDKNETDGAVLKRLAESINNSGSGVTANAITVKKNTVRLAIVSDETGSDNSITITNDSGSSLLDGLGLPTDSVRDVAGKSKGGFLKTDTAELDSLFTLNGVEITHASNTISDVVNGLTISLLKTHEPGDSPETITVSNDSEALQGEIKGFIEDYNKALKFINDRLKRDPASNTRGEFAGNSTIVHLRLRLREHVSGANGENSSIRNINELGIEINRDGTLSIKDEEKFEETINADANGVRNFFSADGGVANKFEEELTRFTRFGGVIGNTEKTFRESIRIIDSQTKRLNSRLRGRESNLRRQFIQLQRLLRSLQSQQQSLQRIGNQFQNTLFGSSATQFNTFAG